MPKTNAEMCREYRRKKNGNKIKKKSKSSTERSREFRARKKQLLNNQNRCSNISVNVTDVTNGSSYKRHGNDVCCCMICAHIVPNIVAFTTHISSKHSETSITGDPQLKRDGIVDISYYDFIANGKMNIDETEGQIAIQETLSLESSDIKDKNDIFKFKDHVQVKSEPMDDADGVNINNVVVKEENDLLVNGNSSNGEVDSLGNISLLTPIHTGPPPAKIKVESENIELSEEYIIKEENESQLDTENELTKEVKSENVKKKKKKHIIASITPKDGEKSFSCYVCARKFQRISYLNQHFKTHSIVKPFVCTICNYRCKTKARLNIHVKIHSDDKPLACDNCDYRCNDKAKLRQHIRIHFDKTLTCTTCDYKCYTNNSLKLHMRTHTSEKPFACNFCDFRCKRSISLKLHVRTRHTNEKRFACDICGVKNDEKKCLTRSCRNVPLTVH